MKGLPLAYSKDMQDDKQPVFEAHDLLAVSLAAMTGMVESATFNAERMRARGRGAAMPPPPISPTGWCARPDVPFREAHHITGRAVRLADEAQGAALGAAL